jgi:two-component system cell cycle sensor histidine kinase/response regulator CckA
MGKRIHTVPAIENLKPGDHLCCVYETEEEHRAVLSSFLRQGLERGEKVIYVVDDHAAKTILGYLCDDGVDAEPYLSSGQLAILTRDDTYMRDGVFDPDGMIALLQSATDLALAEGYPALRVTSEMAWALRGLASSERLIEYEAKLNIFFPGSRCTALCQYNRRRFDPQVLLNVLCTHPVAVVGTEVYGDFYYVPPDEWLGPDVPAAKLRHCLDNLATGKRAAEALQVSHRFLETANRHTQMLPLLHEFVAEVQAFTGCSAVGLRVLDDEGNIPYQAYRGFSRGFYESESPLSIKTGRCMCINVIAGEIDPALPFYTPGGSFYMNGTTRFLATVSEEEKGQTRNVCNQAGYESVGLAPIRLGDRILGLIHVADPREGMVPLEVVELLERVGQLLGTAIQRVSAEEELQQLNRELALHHRAGQAFSSSLDLDRVLATVLEEVRRLMDVTACSVWLVDPETDELVCRQATGPHSEVVRGWRLPPGAGLAGWAVRSGESLIVADARADERHLKGLDPKDELRLRSVLSAPLQVRQDVIGVLQAVDSAVGRFDAEDLALLEPLAASAATAIENARLYEQTQREIAERERVEAALRQERDFAENLVETAQVIVLVLDTEGRIVRFNPYMEEISGYRLEEVQGQDWFTTFLPDRNGAAIRDLFQQAIGDIQTRGNVSPIVTKDGREREIEWYDKTLRDAEGDVVGLLTIGRDITQRQQAEEALRRRAAHQEALNAVIATATAASGLSDLLENALDHTLRALRLETGAIWVDSVRAIHNLPPDIHRITGQVAQEADLTISEPEIVEDWQSGTLTPSQATMAPAMVRLGIRASLTVPVMAEERRIGGLSLAASEPRPWSSEEIALVKAIGQQLGGAAERLRLLDKVREQVRQVRQIMDTVPEGVLLLDARGQVVLANPLGRKNLLALAGVEVGDTLAHLGDRPLEELLTSPPQGLWHQVKADGRSFEVIARPLEAGPEPEGWMLVVRDVTRERDVQRYVQQQERLAAVGQLAAGIAHDFNNIMAVIALYARMSLRTTDLPEQMHERLNIIDQQVWRANELIQQVLDFSRHSMLERHPVDLLVFLKEQVKMLERTVPESVQMALAYDEGEYVVNADPTRMQQAIMNLVINARDAMPEGGQLRIGIGRTQIAESKRAPLPEMAAGEWVRITVADTGTGIPDDVLPHIFDPFFTTKPAGAGTGLGLSQVYGIVKAHDGHVDVATEVGQGTTFTIYLPVLPSRQAQVPAHRAEHLKRGQGQMILVVEDNDTTRKALVDSLELLGYRTVEAANGREALALLEQEQHADAASTAPRDGPAAGPSTSFRAGSGQDPTMDGQIALVLSDLVMPDMGGRALFQALRERGSTTKVVLATGHSLDRELEDLRAQGLSGWLLKPPKLEQLAQVVAQALEGDGV